MSKLKIALAGLGRIGKIHLNNLCYNFPEIEIVGVMDPLDSTKETADEFNIPLFLKDFDSLLSIPELDAVVICSPTDTHANYVIKAAHAGKQIFC